jgi:hypothetical protein
LGLPALADAVTGAVSVPRGNQVPQTVRILRTDQPPQDVAVRTDPTGNTGTFEADLAPGKYQMEAKDHLRTSFTVTPGATSFSVPLRPIEAWMVQNPGVLLAFGIGLGYDGAWFGNLDKTLDRTTITDRDSAGNVLSRTVTDADPALINRAFDKPFELNGVFLDVPIGLGGWSLGSATLYPAVVGTFGWYDFEYAPQFKQTGSTTTFSGDGLMFGGGLDLLVARGPWFAAVSFLYRTNVDTSVDRSRVPPPPPGGSVAQDGDLDYAEWVVAFRLGRTFRTGWRYVTSVGPFVGAQGSWTDVTVNSTVVGTFANGSSRTVQFQEELENDSWRALLGVDVHVTSGLFARIQGSFNGDDQAMLVKLVYRFDFCNDWVR